MIRFGIGFIKFLFSVAFVVILVVLGWGVFANWDNDYNADGKPDGFTFRVFDPGWYAASRAKAKPYLEQSKELMTGLWADSKQWVSEGDELLAEWKARRAERQLRREQARIAAEKQPAAGDPVSPGTAAPDTSTPDAQQPAAPVIADNVTGTAGSEPATAPDQPMTAAPAAPAGAKLSPATARLEQKIHNAEDSFAEGMEFYKQANPAEYGWTDETVANANQARERFALVRDLLQDQKTLEEYRSAPDHDPALLSDAEQMLEINMKLLYNANKMSSSM